MASFWRELRRRNVFKVGAAYAVLGWLVLQVANNLFPNLGLPAYAQTLVAVLLLLGLPFALLLAWVYEITPQGIKKTDEVSLDQSVRHVTGQRLNYLVTGLLLIAVAYLVVDDRLADRASVTRATVNAVAGNTGTLQEVNELPSVAVLPFVNDSPDPEQEYFVDGLSGALIDALNRIQGLRVTGGTSSFYFKDKDEDPSAIAAKLGVGNLLNGNVQKSGDRLRIRAELVEPLTGTVLWGETYERPLDDIFVIQDDITRNVARALEITLGVGELGTYPGMTRNAAAYEELLKGHGYVRQFGAESFQRAIGHYLRATELDQSFSVAWMALAGTYRAGSQNVPGRSVEWRRQAVDAADRARARTPDAPDVLWWEANRARDRGSWSELARLNEELLRAGIQSSPFVGGPADLLLQVGRPREALPHLERMRELEPLAPEVALALGAAYAQVGALPEALAEFDRGLALGGEMQDLLQGFAALAALASGDRDEIDRRLAAPSRDLIGIDASLSIDRFLDDPAGAAAEIRSLAAPDTSFPDFATPLILAHWAAYYGEAEAALALFRKMQRDLNGRELALSLWHPQFADMRKLPGFKDLVLEMGYVEYWREYGWGDFCEPAGEDDFECE